MHRRTYSDKIHFPQLCIKCGIAKSSLGTHTALQVPMLPVEHIQVVLKSKWHFALRSVCEIQVIFRYLYISDVQKEYVVLHGVIAFGQTRMIPAKILVVHHFFVIINTGCSLIVASILGKVKWLTKVNVMEADYVEIPNLQENWACKNRAWEQGYKKQYIPIKFSSLLPCT